MNTIDIHDYHARLAQALDRVDKSELQEASKKNIHDFAQYLQMRAVSAPRIEKYVGTLRLIGLALGKPFKEATRADLESFMFKIRSRQDRSVWTKNDYAVTLHRFYRWLEGGDKKIPNKVSGITTTINKHDKPRVKKAELLTEEDIQKLLRAADTSRDRALIAAVWDTGGRIGEVGGLSIGDLTFNKGETQIDLHGKTGSRTVLAIECTEHLLNWLQNHPRKDDPSAPLWISLRQPSKLAGKALPYRALYAIFERTFQKAGIAKHFNPHLFRHSRATWCVEHGWSTYELCQHFGWELDSSMPAVYLSLSDGMVHDKMRATYGLVSEKVFAQQLEKCPRCAQLANAGSSTCFRCGYPLKTNQRYEEFDQQHRDEEALTALLRYPEVAAAIRAAVASRKTTAVSEEVTSAGPRNQPG